MNGGMLRCWNIAKQLSGYFDVDLLCLQPGIEKTIKEKYEAKSFPRMQYVSPEKNFTASSYKGFNKLKTAIKYRWHYKTLSGTNSMLVDVTPLLKKIKGNAYDIILLEHIESLVLIKKLKKHFPQAKFILDTHNVDHVLLKNKVSEKRLAQIKLQESTLYKSCDIVLTCSEKDKDVFEQLNQNKIQVVIVPNGVDTNTNMFRLPEFSSNECNIIFCGSLDYEPNYTGMIWFLKTVWPALVNKFPFIKMAIVGRGTPDNEMMKLIRESKGINFIGETKDVIPYYRNAQLAIVPILIGSGTRLKILEAMSLGVPVISTTIGAEGIDYTNGKNIIIADTADQFINKLETFVSNPAGNISISENASAMMEKEYSWDVIGRKLKEKLEELKACSNK